jgi:hypothetical protein
MDNLSAHKAEGIRRAIEQRKAEDFYADGSTSTSSVTGQMGKD